MKVFVTGHRGYIGVHLVELLQEHGHSVTGCDIARAFIAFMPAAKITFTGEAGADPRNYRVNCDLLNSLLPDFELQYSLATGVDELHRKTVHHGFSAADFEGDQFVPPRTLNKRMDLLRKAAADPASSPCLDASGGGHQ